MEAENNPCIVVVPNPSTVDENISILVKNLEKGKPYTLHSHTIDQRRGGVFECFAHYSASATGEIDLSIHSSKGGCYKGISSMGLLWNLRSSTKNKRSYSKPVQRNDIVQPMDVTIAVHNGFIEEGNTDLKSLAKVTLNRVASTKDTKEMKRRKSRKNSIKDLEFKPAMFKRTLDESPTEENVFEQPNRVVSTAL